MSVGDDAIGDNLLKLVDEIASAILEKSTTFVGMFSSIFEKSNGDIFEDAFSSGFLCPFNFGTVSVTGFMTAVLISAAVLISTAVLMSVSVT